MEEILHTRGGEGAGDIIGALNVAAAWSAHYNRHVHLCLHWGKDRYGNPYTGDFKVMPEDPESIEDRYRHVYERLWKNDIFSYENVWGSDMFSYVDMLMEDNELRRKYKPKRWISESGALEDTEEAIPFHKGCGAEWRWNELPTVKKKICAWSPLQNSEDIKSYKSHPLGVIHWNDLFNSLRYMFPDYEIVKLTYRDDFRDVYEHIRDCAFCIGYDGMWHVVAKNFGKLFITATTDISVSHSVTNPHAPAFRLPEQFYQFIHNCAYEEGFLKREQELAHSYHNYRLARHTKHLLFEV